MDFRILRADTDSTLPTEKGHMLPPYAVIEGMWGIGKVLCLLSVCRLPPSFGAHAVARLYNADSLPDE